MPEIIRASKRVLAIIQRLRRGEKLCQSKRLMASGATEVTYFYEPSGQHVSPISAERAIASGYLRANGDGLFQGDSQTWSAA